MYKKRILIVLIVTLLLSSFIASCGMTNNTAPGNTADTSTPAIASAEAPTENTPPPSAAPTPEPSASPSAAVTAGIEYWEKTWSNGSTTTVMYPEFLNMSDSAAQEKINKLIYDTVTRDLDTLENGTEYELTSRVTFNSPTVISMYFEGYINVPGSIHPNQFLRTITIDVKKQEIVTLPALVSISDGFADALFNGQYSSMSYDMTDEYRTAIKDNLTGLGTDFWLSELRNADTDSSATSSYLTDDALVISVSVPHVMGDHVEIRLSFKELTGYQTDNLLWQEIAK